ncbi:hypothetical protein BU17DRAFT_74714 [Hysterangium stoloniferum]|nr:hypothetical protein BU17DRAFT_74714 [Hysterangium stoloniferum]
MTEETDQKRLAALTLAAGALSGPGSKSVQPSDLATVLKSRLERNEQDLEEADLKTLQYMTAKKAMRIVEETQNLLDQEFGGLDSGSSAPLLGTRDLSHVRMLLSIIFKWAVEPLLAELEPDCPGVYVPALGQSRVIDLTERRINLEDLPDILMSLLNLIFGKGEPRKIRQTWITTSILSRHTVDILTPCLIIGWARKPVAESFENVSKEIKTLSIRLINLLPPHEAITTLGTILGSTSTMRRNWPHISKACGFLLSKQLFRPEGIRGFCIAVLGEDDDNAASVDKLEHISKVLISVPAASPPQAYFESMIPRVLALLLPSASEQTPSSHKRAAAFTLSRMLSSNFQHNSITSDILLPILHRPFLSPPSPGETEASEATILHLTPIDSLRTIETFLLHTDPSPTGLSTLLTPILPELYTLLSMYHASKIADPNIKESLQAMLNTWGRVVNSLDAVAGIWKIVSGFGGNWEINPEGSLALPSISLETAAKLEEKSMDDEVDIESNPFNLRPDPLQFVVFLKGLDRKDVSSEIFVKLLTEYRDLKENDEQPMRTLLYLQLIVQMQSQLSETVLSEPEHILSFIKSALSLAPTPRPSAKPPMKKGLRLSDLRIIEPEEEIDRADSDDEDDLDELGESGGKKDEMTITAITLLLSVLEGNPNLSPQNMPDLSNILSSLNSFSTHTSSAIRQLVQEARLVLIARTASSSAGSSTTSRTTAEETAQETYQRALKLLQDPIIPVRAHGLQLLRDLVSRPSKSPTGSQLNPALIPGILSIFLQSIQDEESYLFLNGVQGLAAMVDGYGKNVLRGLMDVYLTGTGVGGSGGAVMLKQELDARIRVGEALNTVIKRCGGTLGWYVNILIPPLLTILQSSHLPTTLRSSALSILAQCVATNALALNAYMEALWDTCIELIQLESVAAKCDKKRAKEPDTVPQVTTEGDEGSLPETSKPSTRQLDLMDTNPTTVDSKAAPLRRSALHLFSQVLRANIKRLYDAAPDFTSLPQVTLDAGRHGRMGGEMPVSSVLLKRSSTVLSYVAATDEDGVTKVMASEASELVKQYKEAVMGIW